MKQTGELLKKAREASGLSLHEVSLSLKISSRTIQAIEDGDQKSLPAKTFLRGFVKSYANLLKMDEEVVLNLFYSEMGTTTPKLNTGDATNARQEKVDVSRPKPDLHEPIRKTASEKPDGNEPVNTSEPAQNEKSFSSNTKPLIEPSLRPIDQNKSPRVTILTIVSVILVILIISTNKIIEKYSKESEADPSINLEIVNTPIVPTPSQELMTTAPQSLEKAPEVLASTPVSTPKEAASIQTVLAQDAALKKPEAPPITPVVNEPKKDFPRVLVPEGRPIELIVEAMENIEIEYSSNNSKKSTIRLTPEQVHTFKSRDGLKVSISNGGAVNLILNGRDLGIPGDLGKSIKLSY